VDKAFSRQYVKIYFKRVDCDSQSQKVSVRAEEIDSQRRWTCQVASSGRSYVRVIVVILSVTVNESSNKTASSKPESTISCHGTPDT
jgi:hypothetical protein